MKAVSLMLLVSTLLLFIGCKTDDIDNRREECPGNVDIGLQAITSKTATLKWLETQGFASNYEYGERGFVLGTGIKGNTSDESVILEDLEPDTEYDFYLQSICTAEITGEFTSNPYPFSTLSCTDLNAEKISIVGYVEDGDFQLNLYPGRNADEWQAVLLPNSSSPPDSNDSSGSENNTRFKFSEIDPSIEYTFYVRGKCNGVFSEWITKSVDPGNEDLFSPCLTRVQDINTSFENISFNVLTSSSISTEIIEENTDKETGITIESNGSFQLNPRTFHNQYIEYVKANTNYEIFTRVKCGSSFSEYVKVTSFVSPKANAATLTEGNLIDQELQLIWIGDYGYNSEFCQAYNEVVYEIAYGPEGFTEDEGTLIITDGIREGRNLSYNLPLNVLESGITYEFSIRSVVNGNSRSEWNASHCYSSTGRLAFTVP